MARWNDVRWNAPSEGQWNDGGLISDPAPLKQIFFKVITPIGNLKQLYRVVKKKIVGGR